MKELLWVSTLPAIGGKGFCVVAGDTRVSSGYTIVSRTVSKLCNLTTTCVLASSGMVADIEALQTHIKQRILLYTYQMKKEPSLQSIAHLLSETLYSRRFFPYYAFNLLCGLDENGNGAVYGYDAIGSFDKMMYGVVGSGRELIVPIFDNQFKDHNCISPILVENSSFAIETIRDAMHSCTEREIHTGDYMDIAMVLKDGIKTIREDLRKD